MDIETPAEVAAAAAPPPDFTDLSKSTSTDDNIKDPTSSDNIIQVANMTCSTSSMEASSSSATEDTICTGDSNTNTGVIASTEEPVSQETEDPGTSQDSEGILKPLNLADHAIASTTSELVLQETAEPHNSQGVFKLPNPPINRKRPLPSSAEGHIPETNSVSCKIATSTSDETASESITQIPDTVNIFTKDSGPQWYEVHENIQNISKTIVPARLPEAFKLPVFGRPESESKSDLEAFYDRKSKEFFEGIPDDAYDEAERSVSDCISKIRSKLVKVPICIPVAGMLNEDMLVMKPKPDMPPEEDLTINNMFRYRKEKDITNLFTKKMKYRGIRLLPMLKEDEKDDGIMLEPGQDLIFHVRIYRPFPYCKQKAQYRGRHSVFARDLILTGRHKLTELRDNFVCSNDVDMRLDVSERINDTPTATAKDLFPSGFLFINNVFYVDKRLGCIDTSAKIREWAVTRGIGTFPCKDMGAVTLQQLHLKLGHPEVYVHQGNCEHLFTFSEIRLVNASDPLNLSHYPCHSAISQNQTVYCTACADFGAKYIVTDCDRVPFDPAFFCDTCLKYYLYKDGKKIGSFKAYSYRANEIHTLKTQA